jgi:outer membrane lipoprotein-sorting protein
LLAAITGLVAAIVAGAAIAVASGTGGPVAKPQGLARAVHQAITATPPQSVSANITFTNNLIPSSNVQGSDPLLSGTTHGYLWADKNHLRLQLPDTGSGKEANLVINGNSWWVYDPGLNTVYQGTLPANTNAKAKSGTDTVPTLAQVQSELNQLMSKAMLSGPVAGDTGGQPSYTVTVQPKHAGGLLGQIQLAWDATHGVPLSFSLYASHNGQRDASPALQLTASNVTFDNVHADAFNAAPPSGATVVKVAAPASSATGADKKSKAKGHKDVTGVAAVARHLSFKFAPPSQLVGLKRQSVQLLDWGGSPAALTTYGQGLGAIAVIQQTAASGKSTAPSSGSGDHQGLTLPTVTLGKTAAGTPVSGTELDTAIGTGLRFTAGNVTFTVIGSVVPAAAHSAATQLVTNAP